MMACARIAKSCTLMYCCGSGRPVALPKWLWVRPSSFAFSVIRSANAASVPASASAKTMQASLPDWMIMPRTRSSTGTRSPTLTNISEPSTRHAFSLTGSVSVSFRLPSFSASKTM